MPSSPFSSSSLYPRYSEGTIDPYLFQFTLAVIVSVIFALVTSGLYYYGSTLTMSLPPERTGQTFGKADGFWLIGYSLMLLEPTLILFTIKLPALAVYGLILWIAYLYLTMLQYRKHTKKK